MCPEDDGPRDKCPEDEGPIDKCPSDNGNPEGDTDSEDSCPEEKRVVDKLVRIGCSLALAQGCNVCA